MKQIVEHLQLLSTLDSRGQFDLIYNLGYTNSSFRKILEATHSLFNRKRIEANRHKVTIGDSQYTVTEILRKLLHDNIASITINSEIYFIIYKLNSESIPQSMRNKLKDSLEYTPMHQRFVTSSFTKTCGFCGETSNTDICFRCKGKILKFTEYRRESFEVPVNYFNFTKFIEGEFELKYKDWRITRGGDKLNYKLVQELYESVREDYELPFVEYQLRIL